MSSDSVTSSLQKASDKASSEIQAAAGVISKGCDPTEAIATKIGNGPDDANHEFSKICEQRLRSPKFNEREIAFRIDQASPLVKFRISSNGQFIVPLAQDLIPGIGSFNHSNEGEAIKKTRDDRDRLSKNSAKNVTMNSIGLLKIATTMQSSSGLSQAMRPDFTSLLASGPLALSLIPSIVTLGALRFLKRTTAA
ncbi:hypothetical protein [Methylobacterium sp. J-090]|uniref:hypothetical protein n=1 Tax=Methylobacterium sp. J-090 TaxID=2836666 RepID=UPI001FB9E25B|nr:hypothetical protein [Methylobacterium sp. J-090]MCJ2082385.1 hypothetical protein [Methylobacterium sp. J-090]